MRRVREKDGKGAETRMGRRVGNEKLWKESEEVRKIRVAQKGTGWERAGRGGKDEKREETMAGRKRGGGGGVRQGEKSLGRGSREERDRDDEG